jgi:hypothetical protein
MTFVHKIGAVKALIAPNNAKVCSGRDLAEAFVKADLTVSEAKAWRRELRAAHKNLKKPADR